MTGGGTGPGVTITGAAGVTGDGDFTGESGNGRGSGIETPPKGGPGTKVNVGIGSGVSGANTGDGSMTGDESVPEEEGLDSLTTGAELSPPPEAPAVPVPSLAADGGGVETTGADVVAAGMVVLLTAVLVGAGVVSEDGLGKDRTDRSSGALLRTSTVTKPRPSTASAYSARFSL